LKTTARVVAPWVGVVLGLSANISIGGPPSVAVHVALCTAPVAQTGTSDAKHQANDLLQRARQLIKQDDLVGAELLISQAEALNVDYSMVFFGDTPRKLRKELDRKRSAAPKSSLLPSGLFPFGSKKEAAPRDPFAAKTAARPASTLAGAYRQAGGIANPTSTADSPSPREVTPLSRPSFVAPAGSDIAWPSDAALSHSAITSPSGTIGHRLPAALTPVRSGQAALPAAGLPSGRVLYRDFPTAPGASAGISMASDQSGGNLLLHARRALAEQDVRRATDLVRQARTSGATFDALGDTPDKVDAAIREFQDVMNQPQNTEAFRRAYARMLIKQADALLRGGDCDKAEYLADLALRQHLTYGPYDTQPSELLERIAAVRKRTNGWAAQPSPGGVIPAGGQYVAPATGGFSDGTASHALYHPSNDPTRNVLAAAQVPTPAPPSPGYSDPNAPPPPGPMPAPADSRPASDDPYSLYQQGRAALEAHDGRRALQFFQQAAAGIHRLDPVTAQSLQEYLQLLTTPPAGGQAGVPPGSIVDETMSGQRALALQLSTEIALLAKQAQEMLPTDAPAALALFEDARLRIQAAGLDPASRDRLLRRIDQELVDVRRFIDENRPRLEREEENRRIYEDLERQRLVKLEIQEKFALMVDEARRLMDEGRFHEAEVVAKRASELDPENPVATQLLWFAKLVRRHNANEAVRAAKEDGFIAMLHDVDVASIPFDTSRTMEFPPFTEWQQITERSRRLLERRGGQRTEQDIQIEQKLRTPVSLDFQDEPLSSVLGYLAQLADVNLYLDPHGLAQEAITSDTPVTIHLRQEIMLKSALNLILEPLRLSYVIKDEVLQITSEQRREGEVITVTYPVADLVIPIPNFVPGRMGLDSQYHRAMSDVGFGVGGPYGTSAAAPMAVLANNSDQQSGGMINPAVLAQLSGSAPRSGVGAPVAGFGPGGLGGGANADFDSLIELITSTIQPTTWDAVGGSGSIAPFETNLSIVVSNTQDVHEEIVDLLEQLRRLQDLQVTIEVRFITLNDNFFERIGVDFDFDIDDDIDRPFQVFGRQIADGDPATGAEPSRNTLDVDYDRSVTVGMSAPGVFSADLDIPFTQNSFGLAVPQFGGFDAAAGAQLGFAILSDIEAFFFINAAQGDRRSNVLQAPKVTLFNGQQAFVSDTSQSPFVISVIPVVGDFAAAQQPVIVVLSEGTFMTVQAVVSNDRRFVRLTVVPFFSKITDVQTFQFTGSQTTTTSTSADSGVVVDPDDPDDDRRDNVTGSSDSTVTSDGTTVQLPTFSFVTVTTTVSVPDGGTVLLGGIKRLSEGRNEFGVPILNKIPYLNRLFKNVGIGRETQSLMMMVTPRIIIQEEEEERLGILTP